METDYKDSKIALGNEQWTVKYFPQVRTTREGKYLKAARVPSRKEIWLSLKDIRGNKIPVEEVVQNFNKAILPIVIEFVKEKYGEQAVSDYLSEQIDAL